MRSRLQYEALVKNVPLLDLDRDARYELAMSSNSLGCLCSQAIPQCSKRRGALASRNNCLAPVTHQTQPLHSVYSKFQLDLGEEQLCDMLELNYCSAISG